MHYKYEIFKVLKNNGSFRLWFWPQYHRTQVYSLKSTSLSPTGTLLDGRNDHENQEITWSSRISWSDAATRYVIYDRNHNEISRTTDTTIVVDQTAPMGLQTITYYIEGWNGNNKVTSSSVTLNVPPVVVKMV